MHFGVAFANTGPLAEGPTAAACAQAIEAAGFDSVWTVEHVLVPAGYESTYPYAKSGKMPGGETWAIPDPLIWLAYVAAATERLKLGTGILILASPVDESRFTLPRATKFAFCAWKSFV